jgi:hypothetical protein
MNLYGDGWIVQEAASMIDGMALEVVGIGW